MQESLHFAGLHPNKIVNIVMSCNAFLSLGYKTTPDVELILLCGGYNTLNTCAQQGIYECLSRHC